MIKMMIIEIKMMVKVVMVLLRPIHIVVSCCFCCFCCFCRRCNKGRIRRKRRGQRRLRRVFKRGLDIVVIVILNHSLRVVWIVTIILDPIQLVETSIEPDLFFVWLFGSNE
ncbi:hypothetical protein J3Q64DRAFT_1756683 [Phycomyces blakesleeanus]|uniref:Uncharacterized protein n=1 Tax=Phycomyces blakesleeanus TaxID=4837 RepID=A0ABR3ASU0_PHYBL